MIYLWDNKIQNTIGAWCDYQLLLDLWDNKIQNTGGIVFVRSLNQDLKDYIYKHRDEILI